GLIRHIGLSNVNVTQIKAAQKLVDVDYAQVSLSVFDLENIRNGVVEYCRDHGIRLIAYRPVGGKRSKQLLRDPVLSQIAERHATTQHEVALALLLSLAPNIIPIPGATRAVTAASIARVLELTLSEQDLTQLEEHFPAARVLKKQESQGVQRSKKAGEVVLV